MRVEKKLPKEIDWAELDRFLINTSSNYADKNFFTCLSENWNETKVLKEANLSSSSLEILECLADDLTYFYSNAVVKTNTGIEDRTEKYRLLKELLFSKYSGLSEATLCNIYSDFLRQDR